MSKSTFPIVGIPTPEGHPIPLRQEITAWADDRENAHQVSLFLRALIKIKDLPVEDQLGYFQIAGIHSYPLVPWDGVGQPPKQPNPPGFCNHNLVTFPTWHRPYMLLYEQVLHKNMLELIDGWQLADPEKETWKKAADQFRLPYWDWARKQSYTRDYGVPEICTAYTWSVIKPGTKDTYEDINNPLTGYLNPKKDEHGKNVPMGDPSMGQNAIKNNGPLPWSKCIGISRYGILSSEPESEWIDGVNNWKYCNKGIANPQWYDKHPGPLQSSSFADAVSRMFTPGYFQSWETFASTVHNDAKNRKNTSYMSLEYIHNIVHNATGGPYMKEADLKRDHQGFTGLGLGHMSDVPVAAFDPIFWLHHGNIDRLCAMWQVLNWEMWFNNPNPYPKDPSPSDPLHPFHYDTQGNSWTSDRGRDWRHSHYQYDDLKDMPPGDPTPEYQASLWEHISQLYPSTSSIIQDTPGFTLEGNKFNDYLINIIYDRYALNGTAYSILFYIGEPTLPFSLSKEDQNFVGAVYTFSAALTSDDGQISCDNCGKQKEAKVLSEAQIPLTLPLIRRAALISNGAFGIPATPLGPLEPQLVERVLDVGLKWYFVEIGGREADPSEFPSTEIAVLKGQGSHPAQGHIMPGYRKFKKLELATKHKQLGYGNDMGPNGLIKDDDDA